jgi:hypothetical protein
MDFDKEESKAMSSQNDNSGIDMDEINLGLKNMEDAKIERGSK